MDSTLPDKAAASAAARRTGAATALSGGSAEPSAGTGGVATAEGRAHGEATVGRTLETGSEAGTGAGSRAGTRGSLPSGTAPAGTGPAGEHPAGAGPGAAAVRRRKRLTNRISDGLRDLSIQMALFNHQVGAHLDLRDADLECLDLIGRFGPIGPTALAKRAGLHPATLTGVLDRLERGGWVVRTPNPSDRRAVLVQIIREREAEVARMYAGLGSAVERLCSDLADDDLMLVAEFLLRTARASRSETETLAGD